MLDFLNLKAKAEALQKNAKQAVEELEKVTVSERSADESVTVTLTGNGKMVEVKIDPSFCFPELEDFHHVGGWGLVPLPNTYVSKCYLFFSYLLCRR